jgi:5'(3')-deoxyribonucleotidase
MREERFVLGVDLDGTVADFYGGLRPIAAEWLGKPVEALPAEVSYGLPEWGIGPNEYDELHRFAVTQRDLFGKLALVPGAGPALRRLAYDHDVRIRIITHRLCIKYAHQLAVRQTIEWLDQQGIPYWDLCFLRDKGAVGADLYVEDGPPYLEALIHEGRRVIIFSNSTNRSIPGPRAHTWEQVEAQVTEALAEWLGSAP